MLFLTSVSLLLLSVYGQDSDPTKVCLPDLLQINLTSVFQNNTGVISFDYPKQIVGIRFVRGVRGVYNLADKTVAFINELDGSCTKTPLSLYLGTILAQCLPADATLLSTSDLYLGLNPNRLEIQGWEYHVPGAETVRTAVTKGNPSIPFIRQIIRANTAASDVELFSNAKESIDDQTVFTVPDVCPLETVVG